MGSDPEVGDLFVPETLNLEDVALRCGKAALDLGVRVLLGKSL